MSDKDDSTECTKNFVVGNKSPPTQTQFKPGQSGNSKGRPKARRSFEAEILAELEQPVGADDDVRDITITKRLAIAKSLVGRAIKGDFRVAMMLFEISKQADEKEGDATEEVEQKKFLEEYIEQEVQKRMETKPKESL